MVRIVAKGALLSTLDYITSRASLVVPKIMLTTSAVSFQIADESNYKSFNLSYSGSLVTLAIQGGNGQINRVFGIN